MGGEASPGTPFRSLFPGFPRAFHDLPPQHATRRGDAKQAQAGVGGGGQGRKGQLTGCLLCGNMAVATAPPSGETQSWREPPKVEMRRKSGEAVEGATQALGGAEGSSFPPFRPRPFVVALQCPGRDVS